MKQWISNEYDVVISIVESKNHLSLILKNLIWIKSVCGIIVENNKAIDILNDWKCQSNQK